METPTSIANGSGATPFPTLRRFAKERTESEPLLIGKADGQLNAYRDLCPASNMPLHLGDLRVGLVVCSLGHRFDVKRAGFSPDNSDLHLAPFPLLTEADGTVKVSIAHFAASAHAEPSFSHE